ncbi:a disintegrin and metalloproteinase with thrombospondin motifs 1 [Nephila pilipes]|uniref:A disintegrin and metalloproteinase with thrombospondin motifs 1 n=1 Tax=Nephila pilipes TaxID=299642 RepID=A0A8X6NG46_NEPPI|nr:a disintegrin and metalloproteinase with thrombospondin motifs 1 [Nephila pilipes]
MHLFPPSVWVLTTALALLWVESGFSTPLNNNQLHYQMSSEELQRIFQVDSPDQVPEYQVVQLRSISKRDTSSEDVKQIHVPAFGKKLQLNLRKNSDFEQRIGRMKVLMAETTGQGQLKYHEPKENPADLGTTYHDEKQMAAILMRNGDNGQLEMEGTIGNELVIQPLPSKLTAYEEEFVDDEVFLDEDEAEELKRMNFTQPRKLNSSYSKSPNGKHIIYKKKFPRVLKDNHSDYLPLDADEFRNTTLRRSKRQASPDTVWPEVLLVVDYESYILHGGNSRDVKRYFISFFNGVDLRYKLLHHPRVRISLAGMIVAKDRDATPYLERNRLRPPNADAVDAAGALTDMGKYLYREHRLPTYDLAVVITKLDMCRRRFPGGRCNRGTAGFAYVGGACVVNKRLEKVNSVAIIEDSGGFSGIIVAAHEIGHLLGCVHDGSPPPSYLGGPGATHCPWEDGFIMSDLRHTERGFKWSSCSVEQFKHFLNGETATCLFNFPHENDLLVRVLPGTMLSLDEQCKRDRGTTACFKDARVCAQLFCFDTASGYCVSYRPAAEGSVCGDGQVCKNGRCLAEIENIIPDYSHVTETYVEAEERMDRSPDDEIIMKSPVTTLPPPSRRARTRRPTMRRPTRSIAIKSPSNRYASRIINTRMDERTI